MRKALSDRGWKRHNFEIRKIVDGEEKESISDEIDHINWFPRGVFAVGLNLDLCFLILLPASVASPKIFDVKMEISKALETEVCKQFVENESFRRTVTDMVFELTNL